MAQSEHLLALDQTLFASCAMCVKIQLLPCNRTQRVTEWFNENDVNHMIWPSQSAQYKGTARADCGATL